MLRHAGGAVELRRGQARGTGRRAAQQVLASIPPTLPPGTVREQPQGN